MGEINMKIIESITIRYFRSVYTLTLPECKDLTIITGKNDVGKSNILKALNLFFCQQTDYLHDTNFFEDYSMLRKEEVKKDTIRGQQFISISVRFLRGDRMPNSLPPSFTVTKRWDMHSSEPKTTSDVQNRMKQYAKKSGIKYSEKTTTTSLSVFLNKIKYVYIPAIKDNRVFSETLNILQQSLFASKNKNILDAPISEANCAIQNILCDLQNDFQMSTGISNFIELPNTLNYTNGLLQINTNAGVGNVPIDKRGDGIRSHYIPKILNFVANHSSNLYIWGFEEPENSYEYRRCIQVAEEFDKKYCIKSQVFITSHSPAFFSNESDSKIVVRIGNSGGKTVTLDDKRPLDEELGYIELYKDFITQIKNLQYCQMEKDRELAELKEYLKDLPVPIVLTEGKTDAELLKIAIQKLGLTEFADYEIKPIVSGKTSNNEALLKYLQNIRDNMSVIAPVIGMFDRDTTIKVRLSDDSEVDIRDNEYVKLGKNIYAFAIPIPHERQEKDNVSIEHYFTDDEIKTECDGKRLFMGNEFYSTGVHRDGQDLFYKAAVTVAGTIKIIEHESNKYVTKLDGTGDFSLSKAMFVRAIAEEKEGFKKISFLEFRKIFDVLQEIANDSKSS